MQTQTNTTHTASLLYELQQLLIQIKTCNDVADTEGQHTVSLLSQHGLQLLHYALFAIESEQTQLNLTSVSAGAAMHDVLHELAPLAKSYGATLEFNASPYLDPVYANETSLRGSVYALLTGMITSSTNGIAPKITIAVQQTKPREQRIGVYSHTTPITLSMLKRRAASRTARMDMSGMSHRSGLGFMVSELLTTRMEAKFSSFEHNKAPGVGFYLPESAQLQLL
jgi:hypothetical protein